MLLRGPNRKALQGSPRALEETAKAKAWSKSAPLHALLRVTAGANDESDKVGAGVLLLRNPDLLPLLGWPAHGRKQLTQKLSWPV